MKAKELRERLGDEAELSSVGDASKRMAKLMTQKMDSFEAELEVRRRAEQEQYDTQRIETVERQRAEGQALSTAQAQREVIEHQERQARLRGGVLGLWDRLSGARKRTLESNAHEADLSRQRDQSERDKQIFEQIEMRREIVQARNAERTALDTNAREVSADQDRYQNMAGVEPDRPQPELEPKLQPESRPELDREARQQAFEESRKPNIQADVPKGPTLDR